MTHKRFVTLSVHPSTRERVKKHKTGGETYDAVITRLLQHAERADGETSVET